MAAAVSPRLKTRFASGHPALRTLSRHRRRGRCILTLPRPPNSRTKEEWMDITRTCPRLAFPLLALLAIFSVLVTSPRPAKAQSPRPARVALYAALGAELTEYDVDIENAALIKRGSVTLPANIQYAWPHPSRQYLYVAWSNGGSSYVAPASGSAPRGSQHGVTAFRIDPASGTLSAHGQPASLPSRPIHVSVDISGSHLLVAYNDPSGVTVHAIGGGGAICSPLKQPAPPHAGVFPPHVAVGPTHKSVFF